MNFRRIFKKTSSEEKRLFVFVKKVFGIRAANISFYKIASTHSSVLPKSTRYLQSNERLEFLGDAILDSIIAHFLYTEHPNLTEGELTKLKSKLVSRKNLNAIAISIDIESVMNHSINSNSKDTSILGNGLEAFIGALYLDKGYSKTEKAVFSLLGYVDTDHILYEQKDYKSLLHEWGQQKKNEVLFRTINELKINGRSEYEVEVLVSGRVHGKAKASSKKKAQQIAAQQAAESLKL